MATGNKKQKQIEQLAFEQTKIVIQNETIAQQNELIARLEKECKDLSDQLAAKAALYDAKCKDFVSCANELNASKAKLMEASLKVSELRSLCLFAGVPQGFVDNPDYLNSPCFNTKAELDWYYERTKANQFPHQ